MVMAIHMIPMKTKDNAPQHNNLRNAHHKRKMIETQIRVKPTTKPKPCNRS